MSETSNARMPVNLAGHGVPVKPPLPRAFERSILLSRVEVGMRLWHDIRAHKRAALLLFAYWLAVLALVPITWAPGIPFPVVVLLFTMPLIAGVLEGRWRRPAPDRPAHWVDRIRGGMLAGALSAEITVSVMKSGFIDEAWRNGIEFPGRDLLVYAAIVGMLGAVLGMAGATLAIILDRFHRNGSLRSL